MASNHPWNFVRAGGFSQARVDSGSDFDALENLDQKLWAALACPVKGLEFDEKTLAFIDGDGDGRIRAPEVIAAIKWSRSCLKNLDNLKAGSPTLNLSLVDDASEDGQGIINAANKILSNVGKEGESSISVDDATNAAASFSEQLYNGDGVIHAGIDADESVQAVITDIVTSLEGVPDRSGETGVNQEKVDTFFADAETVIAWADAATEETLPLGDATAAAAAAAATLKAKIDDFFSRCRLAAFDERALAALNRREEEYLAIAAEDLSVTAEEVSGFPLARVEAGRPLPLLEGVNPAWADAAKAFHTATVVPILGEDTDTLTAEGWATIQSKLKAFNAWNAEKPGSPVAALGVDRLREILGGDSKTVITDLIAKDAALEDEWNAIAKVEKLVRFNRDLHELVRNFVNFTDFYSDDRKAIFEAGTLYLDGRACDLVVRVDNPAKHATLAGLSKAYLAYCTCTRPSGETMLIAAAFTDGDSDFLMVGRNGLFYDRKGRDWDATITKVIDNPISIRQAFWSPYKKFVRMIEENAAKRAAAKEAESQKKLSGAAATTANVDSKTAPPESSKKIDIGTVAALGVAVGAIGTMLTAMVSGFFSINSFWVLCLIIAGIILLISAPSMFIAWLKLRQRNIGPILDSNGWAVNGRAKLTVRFGKTKTHVAELPPGATLSSDDKYADPVNPWPKRLLFLVIVGFIVSLLNTFGVWYTLSDGAVGKPPKVKTVAADVQTADDAPIPPKGPVAPPAE